MKRVVGLLLCGWSWLVSADCPTYRDLTVVRAEPALTWVEREIGRCADDPTTTGLYGGLLLRDGQVGAALIWLEKSLMLLPEQPGVAADYALALARVGESDASSALAQQVLSRNDVPEGLEGLLDDLVRASFWEQGVQLSVGIGVSDNILFEPDLQSLELTFGDDGRAQVPLADPSAPTTRGLIQQSAQWSGRFSRGETEILPNVGLSVRRADSAALADYQSLSGELWLRQGPSALGVGLTDVASGGNQDREGWFVGYDRVMARTNACEFSGKVQYQELSYDESIYDSSITALAGDGVCVEGWEFKAEMSRNQAINDRAGGDKSALVLAVSKTWSMQSGTVQVAGRVTEELDAETYSDFLARGASRKINTYRVAAAWEVPLNARWTVSSQVTHLRQTSNINLFNASGSEIVINMIYTR